MKTAKNSLDQLLFGEYAFNLAHEIIDNDERTNILELKAITGGKQPPSDMGWLWELSNGTRFLCTGLNAPTPFLAEYKIIERSSRGVKLASLVGETMEAWVNPMKFSKTYIKYEVLEEGEELPNGSD